MYFKIHGLYFSQQAMCFFRRPMKSFLHHKKTRIFSDTKKRATASPLRVFPSSAKHHNNRSPHHSHNLHSARENFLQSCKDFSASTFSMQKDFFLFAPFQILPCFFFHFVQLGIVIYVPKTYQWFPCSVNVTINRDFVIICHAVTVLIHVIPPVWIDLP